MKSIGYHPELLSGISVLDRSSLLLYRPGGEQSDCAFNNIVGAEQINPEYKLKKN